MRIRDYVDTLGPCSACARSGPVILIVATIAGAAWMAAWNVQGFMATQIAASEARLTAQILETRAQILETRAQIAEIRKYIVDHLGDHGAAD